MQVSLLNTVILGPSLLVLGLFAGPATAQWGPYSSGGGGWGAHPYAVSSQANNVSRGLAAGAHKATFNRAQQQTSNVQSGIRNTLMTSAQNRTAAVQYNPNGMVPLPALSSASPRTTASAYPPSAIQKKTSVIKWPVALYDSRFEKLRKEVEEPFRKQAAGGTPPTVEEYQKMIDAAGEMKGLLTDVALEVSSAQYKELEKFLDALAGEARGRIEKRTAKQPPNKDPKQPSKPTGD
jgi:hypothetical protein